MNRTELVELVAERTGSDRAVARRHVDAVFDAIIEQVSAGDRVLVTGFGTFDRFERAARTARNPRTGQSIEIAAGAVPRFRFGQTFKNRVAQASNGATPEAAGQVTAEIAQAPAVTEPAEPAGSAEVTEPAEATEAAVAKKAKKPKKDKKAAVSSKKAVVSSKKTKKGATKAPNGKPAKKGSGKKGAKAR
jgi:DNA-binding protein HU-beta